MSTFSKKVAAVVLTATTVVSLSGFGSFASVAHGQTMADLQAMIAQLTAQLAALQNGGGSMVAANFTRDLSVGSKGADVTALQNVLISKGFLAAGLNTGYFGALTKAAVMKWQASAGISNTGYVGPISRGALNAMGGGSTGGNNGGTYVPPVVNTGSSLWVAADNSVASGGSIIAGAGQVRVMGISFTAPSNMGVTVTGLTFTKSGVLGDSSVNNMYIADAVNGNVIAQFQSLSSGVATFSGLNINVAAGQTWRAELRIDISSSVNSGNTIAFDLTGVTTAAGATVAGLPVKGNALTVTSVSNPSIAGFTMTANSVGSSVDAGTNSVLLSDWTMNVTNSPVWLKSVSMTLVGSATKSDVRNLVAKVNGQTVASTAVGADMVVFSFTGTPVKLQTGNSNFSVYGDIAGSPNRTVQLTMLHPYDVVATDSQYNQNITASITTTNATSISIRSGSITVSTASDSPTNSIPAGASGVTIAKFGIYAAGEPVKIKYIDVLFTKAGGSTWATLANVTDALSQVRLVSNDGRQVGNTISTIAGNGGNNDCTLSSSTTITCHFGTSSSNINFIIPANTTSVLSVIADIGSAPGITSLSASLPGNASGSLEGQISFTAAAIGAASGATRTVNSTPLTVAANPSLSSPTYINGAQNARIASFVLTASSAQSAELRSITLDKDSNANIDLQNLKIMVGSTQFGQTQSTVGDAETGMTFSGNSVMVPAGGSVTFDVMADILTSSATGTMTTVIDFNSWTANGGISGSSITFPSGSLCTGSGESGCGQSVLISTGATLTFSAGSNTAPTQNLVMGSTGNNVFTLRALNDNIDDVRITDLTLTDTITSGSTGIASFDGFTLWDGSTQVAGPVSPTSVAAGTSTIAFTLTGSGVIVTKNSSKELIVKANVPTFTSGGAVSNSSHVFKLQNTTDATVKSVGSPSASVTISGTPSGNAQKVYRTKLALSSSVIGTTSGRARTGVDDVANLNFAADAAYQVLLQTISLKFVGGAVTSGTTAFGVSLVDSNTNGALGSASNPQTCTPGIGNSCSVTFSPSFTVSAGTTKAAKVRVDSSSFNNAASTSDSLSILVNAVGDVAWSDGTTLAIQLESTVVPFTVASVSYE